MATVYELSFKGNGKRLIAITEEPGLNGLLNTLGGYPPSLASNIGGVNLLHDGSREDIRTRTADLFSSLDDFAWIAARLLDGGANNIAMRDICYLQRVVEAGIENLRTAGKLLSAMEEMAETVEDRRA